MSERKIGPGKEPFVGHHVIQMATRSILNHSFRLAMQLGVDEEEPLLKCMDVFATWAREPEMMSICLNRLQQMSDKKLTNGWIERAHQAVQALAIVDTLQTYETVLDRLRDKEFDTYNQFGVALLTLAEGLDADRRT